MTQWIGTVLTALAGMVAQPVAAQLYWPDEARPAAIDSFGDWIVACRPDRFCQAVGLPMERDGQGAFAVVYRFAGDPTAWTSIYVPHDAEDPAAPDAIALDVRVTGAGGEVYRATWTADAPPESAEYGPLDPTTHYRARPGFDGHMPFIDAVRAGNAIEIRGNNGFADRVSLSGSAAALRRMDARQGLAGTPTALVERGEAPPPAPRELGPAIGLNPLTITALDPLPPLPADLPPPPEDGDCDRVAPLAWGLADGRTLWGVCELSANTNTVYRFWLVAPDWPIDVEFVRRGLEGESPQILANPVLEDGLVVRSMELGRGLGDCGVLARWVWDAVRGPMLVHFAEMPDCRGIPSAAWPVLLDANYLPDGHESGDP